MLRCPLTLRQANEKANENEKPNEHSWTLIELSASRH
jgi:hypothetical protein